MINQILHQTIEKRTTRSRLGPARLRLRSCRSAGWELILREWQNINGRQIVRKGTGPMRKIVMLLALATLAACSHTGDRVVGGDGDYYYGLVPPR